MARERYDGLRLQLLPIQLVVLPPLAQRIRQRALPPPYLALAPANFDPPANFEPPSSGPDPVYQFPYDEAAPLAFPLNAE